MLFLVVMDSHQDKKSCSERPEWIRPKQATAIFGMGRTKLYELIAQNKIRTVSMRSRGAKHGTRLISYDSLAEYLESLV